MFLFMTSHTCSGLLEEKTNTLPVLGATSTASPNEVEYATDPSEPIPYTNTPISTKRSLGYLA